MWTSNPIRAALLLCGLGLLASCSLLRFSQPSGFEGAAFLLEPPPPWKEARELSVVTFNVKDMYWLSEHRAARMAAIGKALRQLRPDIVCLQEGFVAGDIAAIADELRAVGVEHVVDFPSGAVGSGMWTLSRFPIREVFFVKFSENGAVFDTKGGDWWAGKGAGLVRVELSPGCLLDVYNTHMISGLGPRELHAHRHTQARELAAFVKGATPASIPALLLGDFNCGPGSREFEHLDGELAWQRIVPSKTWLDHVYAYSVERGYRFEVLEESRIRGRVPVAGGTVSFSDHSGICVRVRIVR